MFTIKSKTGLSSAACPQLNSRIFHPKVFPLHITSIDRNYIILVAWAKALGVTSELLSHMPDISFVSKTYRIFLQLLLTISTATNFNRATMSNRGFCCIFFSLCQPLVLYCLISTQQLEYSFLLLGQIMSLLCSKLCDRSSFHSDKKSQVPYNLFFHYCLPMSLF